MACHHSVVCVHAASAHMQGTVCVLCVCVLQKMSSDKCIHVDFCLC